MYLVKKVTYIEVKSARLGRVVFCLVHDAEARSPSRELQIWGLLLHQAPSKANIVHYMIMIYAHSLPSHVQHRGQVLSIVFFRTMYNSLTHEDYRTAKTMIHKCNDDES